MHDGLLSSDMVFPFLIAGAGLHRLNQKKTAVTEGQAGNFPLPLGGSKKVRAYQRSFFEGLTDRSERGGPSSPRKGKFVRLSNSRAPRGCYDPRARRFYSGSPSFLHFFYRRTARIQKHGRAVIQELGKMTLEKNRPPKPKPRRAADVVTRRSAAPDGRWPVTCRFRCGPDQRPSPAEGDR